MEGGAQEEINTVVCPIGRTRVRLSADACEAVKVPLLDPCEISSRELRFFFRRPSLAYTGDAP